MENVTIVSHLTPQEWKKSWEDKVVEDTKQNMRAYQQQNCYWGHFKNDRDFTICHHKEFEIKGMSLGLYFNGRIEDDERGCKIVGKFGKKHSANLFLGMGAALCIAAIIGATARQDIEVSIVATVLLAILVVVYMAKPKKGQQRILNQLEKISFDSRYHKKGSHKAAAKPEKKKKRTITVHSALHFCTRLLIAGWRRKRLTRPTIPRGRISTAPSGDNRILLRAGG